MAGIEHIKRVSEGKESQEREGIMFMKKAKLLMMALIGMLASAITGCESSSHVQNQPALQQSKEQSTEQSQEQPKQQVELNILAAASLSDAMKELKATYEQKHPEVKLTQVFGASGTLQTQI
ncbi:MAG: substrate-binding domain-containing protein, partial [Tumebacillaceae bacterium]